MKTVVLLLLCSTPWLQAAPPMGIYEAINKAGYQRMLTQKIAKCYLSVVAEIEVDKHKNFLKISTQTFEENLKALQNFAPTSAIKEQFRYVKILWRNYKFVYTDAFNRENAGIILKGNNKILKACEEAVELLEQYALEENYAGNQELRNTEQHLSAIINLSGRQRMLTQRITLYAIAKAYGFGEDKLNKQYYFEAVGEFERAYRALVANAYNTTQIYEEYDVVEEHWELLEEKLTPIVKASFLSIALEEQLEKAIKQSELLLFSLDEIVFLYERQKGN